MHKAISQMSVLRPPGNSAKGHHRGLAANRKVEAACTYHPLSAHVDRMGAFGIHILAHGGTLFGASPHR